MAKFCTNCGTPLKEGAKFCIQCGKPLSAAVSPPVPDPAESPEVPAVPAASAPAVSAETPDAPSAPVQSAPAETPGDSAAEPQAQPSAKEKKPKRDRKKQQTKAAAPAQPAENGRPQSAVLTVGSVILLACMAMECLPYLLKAILFLAHKGPFANTVSILLDILGFVAAGVILYFGAKRISKQPKLSCAILFPALWGGVRAADLALMKGTQIWDSKLTIALMAADILVFLLFTAIAVRPLCDLFSGKGECRRRSVFPAWLLTVLAGLIPYFLPMLAELTPAGDAHSFFSGMGRRLFTAFLEAGLLTLAARLQLKHLGEEKKPASGKAMTPAGIFGTAVAVCGAVACFYAEGLYSIPDTVLKDVEFYLVQGEFKASAGNINQLLYHYEAAAEHIEAWRSVSGGGSYSVPGKFVDDKMLKYLSKLNTSADNLRNDLVTSLNDNDIDMWGPLMLMRYREQEKGGTLNEQAQAHRDEIIAKCIAEGCFTADYPLAADLIENSSEIDRVLDADTLIQEKIEIASAVAKAQRGEINGVESAKNLLSLAEKYPQNMNLQLVAGYITSQNPVDNNGANYERAVKALRHYMEMWEEEYGETSTSEQRTDLNLSVAGIMQDMEQYEAAIPLYEKALPEKGDDCDLLQALSFCYTEAGDTDKGYEMSRKLFGLRPDDVTVLWSYCIGALKHGDTVEAVDAVGKLADLVRTDPGDNADSRDELLYNLVTYLALNDSASWTDYQYRVYDGDGNTDEAVLAALRNNEFLYDYVRAVYYEKQKNDQETALPFAKKALAAQENSGRLWFLNGIIYFDSKQYDEAIRAYEQANRLEGNDPTLMFALANAYDATEQYALALEYCEKVMACYPNGVDHSEDNYGVSAHVSGLYTAVKRHLEG